MPGYIEKGETLCNYRLEQAITFYACTDYSLHTIGRRH